MEALLVPVAAPEDFGYPQGQTFWHNEHLWQAWELIDDLYVTLRSALPQDVVQRIIYTHMGAHGIHTNFRVLRDYRAVDNLGPNHVYIDVGDYAMGNVELEHIANFVWYLEVAHERQLIGPPIYHLRMTMEHSLQGTAITWYDVPNCADQFVEVFAWVPAARVLLEYEVNDIS